MPRLQYESWPAIAVYNQVGSELADYSIFHRDRKVFRITTAGRYDNLLRIFYSRAESIVIDKNAMLKVGV